MNHRPTTRNALLAVTVAVACALPASAQNTGSGSTDATTTATTREERGGSWGWLGLLGLAGLLGMRRRDHGDDRSSSATYR